MKRVLFVDDEAQILRSIKRIFSGSSYEVICADNAETALRIMNDSSVDMIVSDMRMPNMDGIELLGLVKQKYPDTIRLILSGYVDEEEITKTLKNNTAKAYIFKPWDNSELVRVINQNLESSPVLPSGLITFINNKSQLPTTHGSYTNIMRAIEENSDLEAISYEIMKDQTISAKVLQIANSAYYGIKTCSVKKALSLLGISELKNLILSLEIMTCLKTSGAGNRFADKIWAHAYMTSKIQHILQEVILSKKKNHHDRAAGLLHKLGIVLMLSYYNADYLELIKKSADNKDNYLYQLENLTYGFSHMEVSAFLLKWWNMPTQIVDAAAHYTAPMSGDVLDRELCCCVHIAQNYAGLILDLGPFCEFLPDTFKYLGIERSDFEEVLGRLIERQG